MKKSIINFIKVGVAGAAFLGFAATTLAVSAGWTAAPAVPPAGNVAAPINVSTVTQTKEGGLVVGNTTGGFVNYGTSALVGHTDIGPSDFCYYNPTHYTCTFSGGSGGSGTSGGGSSSSAPEYMALAKPSSLLGSLISSIAAPFAYAAGTVGTPSGDALHVNGNASVTGAMTVQGYPVCTSGSTTSGCGGSQWVTSGTNIRNGNSGNVGIGTGTTAPTAPLQVAGTSNRNGALMVVSSSGTTNGDNADTTERGLTVAASSAAGHGLLFNVKVGSTNRFNVGGNGNVGIGASNPSRRLHISGAGGENPEFLLENTGQATNAKRFNVYLNGNNTIFRALNDAGTGGQNWLVASNTTGNVNFPKDVDVTGALTQEKVPVCLQNGTNCPTTIPLYRTNPRCIGATGGGTVVHYNQPLTDQKWCTESSNVWYNDAAAPATNVGYAYLAGKWAGVGGGCTTVGSSGPGTDSLTGWAYPNCSYNPTPVGYMVKIPMGPPPISTGTLTGSPSLVMHVNYGAVVGGHQRIPIITATYTNLHTLRTHWFAPGSPTYDQTGWGPIHGSGTITLQNGIAHACGGTYTAMFKADNGSSSGADLYASPGTNMSGSGTLSFTLPSC